MESGSQSLPGCSTESSTQVMETAAEAGRMLLESGSEISRVEDTMRRISSSLGEPDESFFTMGNGIFATSQSKAIVRYIPIKGARLDKVVEISNLSHKIKRQALSLEEVRAELGRIDNLPTKPLWEQLLACIMATMGFGIIFSNSFLECIAAAIAGVVVWLYYLFFGSRHLSKALNNISGGIVGSLCCLILQRIGIGENLGNMIVSTLILLIPGVAFTNGIRDIANEDYLSGMTRMLDALMVFFCLSLGACLIFIVHSLITGSMIMLDGPANSQETFPIAIQAIGGFTGTVAFAVLFGVQRKYYPIIGLVGMVSWTAYIISFRYVGLGIGGSTAIATSVVAFSSYFLARRLKCPSTIFLICGNFPLIPGGGVFWTVYFMVSGQMMNGARYGFLSIEITVAIVLAMITVSNIYKRNSVKGLAERK